MKLPEAIRKQFQDHGRQGGRIRARRLPPTARQTIARRAALRRWTKDRFGAGRFADLGFPGGAMIDSGLEDLTAGKESAESLAVSIAASRLRREGVPLPGSLPTDADKRLYRLLERTHGHLAHTRYLAYVRQVASFADACRSARIRRGRHAQ